MNFASSNVEIMTNRLFQPVWNNFFEGLNLLLRVDSAKSNERYLSQIGRVANLYTLITSRKRSQIKCLFKFDLTTTIPFG